MTDPALGNLLSELDATPTPAVARFDSGGPFRGRLAFLPSAYNPPTLAHVDLLESALEVDGVKHVAAMLTTRNVAKHVFGASLHDRVAMLLELHHERPELAVLAANAARIIDQANALSTALGDVGVDAIVGFDTLERLFDPRYYADMERELAPFFERHRVIAANRGSHGVTDVEAWVHANAGVFAGRILVREIQAYAASLSSTMVRDSLAAGLDELAVSPAVRRYIEQHRLYRPPAT
jgi:nicotinic acid mononucleotide adenylyltransferase